MLLGPLIIRQRQPGRSAECVELGHGGGADHKPAKGAEQCQTDAFLKRVLGDAVHQRIAGDGRRYREQQHRAKT